MPQENVEIVRRLFEAFDRGEIRNLLAALTEDCEWRPPSYAVDGVSYLGPDGYRAWFEGLSESWSSVRLTPALADAGGRHVVAEVTAEFIGRASGTPINQRFWMAYRLDGGKVARMEAFASAAEATEAVGLSE
jgi:uncharacterized protein